MTRPRSSVPSSSSDLRARTALVLAPSGAASRDELARLLAGLGVHVAAVVPLSRSARAVLGEGKRDEVRAHLAALSRGPGEPPVLVVVDRALDPGAQRALERALEAPVLDRTEVVLRVFEQRARTRVAQLEIELARIAHELPRVRDDTEGHDREGGGGRGARGHTEAELRRQRLRARSARLARELERLRAVRSTQAAARREVPRVALVGYTNAGKSSLLRALTGSEVHVEDALFATLDTTVRALAPDRPPRVLVSDTVGFLRNLPHDLVASFRSTLEEACDADLLLLVVDASDPEWREQLRVTREALVVIGAAAPARVVLNKADRVETASLDVLLRAVPGAMAISAHDPASVARLRERVLAFVTREHEADVLVVPIADAPAIAEIRAAARVEREVYDEHHAILSVRAHPDALARWQRALPPRPAIVTLPGVLDAAARYGLRLTPERDALDTSGLDFLAAHARDEQGVRWIVRTPRRDDVIAAAQREARVLRLVRGRIPVAVPDWRVHARDVIAYPRIEGTPVWSIDARGEIAWAFDRAAPPEHFVESFAAMLAALQRIPLELASDAGVPVERPGEAREALARAMDATRDALAPTEPLWARWQRWIADDACWPRHVALAHGDLHGGHLVLDDAARVTGVLDWTEARVTDPALDLALFYGTFGRAALESAVRHLADAGAPTWPGIVAHTIERWASYAVVGAEWALRTGNELALEHARQHVRTIAAETA